MKRLIVRNEERMAASFRGDYAKGVNFCELLERDMEALYRLALLLTGSHQDAEQCFLLTVEHVSTEPTVFKEWAQSWIKRCLVCHAIGIVFPISGIRTQKRELGKARQEANLENGEIDAVIQLPALERFAFVMSVLERYSIRDCSLLLGCSMKELAGARARALQRLAGVGLLVSQHGVEFTGSLQVTA